MHELPISEGHMQSPQSHPSSIYVFFRVLISLCVYDYAQLFTKQLITDDGFRKWCMKMLPPYYPIKPAT